MARFLRTLASDGASSAIWTVAATSRLIRPTWAMTTGPSAGWNWPSPAKFFCSRASISSRPRVFSDFHPVPADLTFAQGAELLKKQVARWRRISAQNPGLTNDLLVRHPARAYNCRRRQRALAGGGHVGYARQLASLFFSWFLNLTVFNFDLSSRCKKQEEASSCLRSYLRAQRVARGDSVLTRMSPCNRSEGQSDRAGRSRTTLFQMGTDLIGDGIVRCGPGDFGAERGTAGAGD